MDKKFYEHKVHSCQIQVWVAGHFMCQFEVGCCHRHLGTETEVLPYGNFPQ
jgi:hypothetical protein